MAAQGNPIGNGGRCERCQRVSELPALDATTQSCGKCGALYPAAAHYCPACGAVSADSLPSPLQSEYGLLPAPTQPIWPMKSWWREDGRNLIAPPCPVCGEKIRSDAAGSLRHIGLARPPWNAGWDGRCAACGHKIEVVVDQRTHFATKRVVILKPAESFHQTFFDEGIVFAGVTIRVEETACHDAAPCTSEVFLSMGELMTLVRALEANCSPLLSQVDWSCDWT